MSKKWVLFSLLLLFFLAASFYLIPQSGSISEKVRSDAQNSLQALLGQPVQINQAQVRLFSPSVILTGVSTTGKKVATESGGEGSEPMMVAEEIQIYFSPWSFFTEAFFIRQIDIRSPSLFLDPQALGEKPFVFDRGFKDGKERFPRVIIRSIQIQNGRLSYRGEGTLKTFSLRNIHARIDPDLKMSRFEIALSGGAGEASTEKFRKKIDRIEGILIATPDKIDLKKGVIASDRTLLRGEGDFPVGKEAPIHLRLEAHLPVEEFDLAALIPGALISEKKLAGEITLHGHLTGAFPKVALTGKVALPKLRVDGVETGSLTSDLSYEGGTIAFSSLSGDLFSGSFTGQAQGPFPPPEVAPGDPENLPLYRVTLQYKQIPLEKTRRAFFASGQEERKSLEGIFIDGDLALSGPASGAGWVAAGRLIAKRHSLFSAPIPEESDRLNRLITLFEAGELDWKWSDRRWTFGPGTVSLPGTKASFQGEWTPEAGWRLDTQVASEEIQRIAEAVHLPVTGRMRLQGRLSEKEAPFSFQGEVALDQWTLLKQPFGTFGAAFVSRGREVVFDQGFLNAPPAGKGALQNTPPYRLKGTLSLADPASPSFDFEAEAAAADPQEFITLFKLSVPLQTRATGRLSIKGTPRAFSVRGPLVLSKGALYGERFDRGKVSLTVTEKEVLLRKVVLDQGKSRIEGEGEIGYDGTYRLALKANRLRIEETRFFQSRLPLLSGQVALEVFGKGTFKKPSLKVIASAQQLQYGEMDGVSGTVQVKWADQSVQVEGTFPEKNFLLTGEIALTEQYPFSFQSRFNRLQIDPFLKSRLPAALSSLRLLASGELKGTGKLSRLDQAGVSGALTEVLADFSGYAIENDGPVTLSSTEGAFRFETARFKGENTALEFHGGWTVLKEWDLFVNGEADLNLIKFFTKEIASGKGTAYLDLRISDRWEQPQIRGALTLQNGTVRTATLPQTVHISSLAVAFNERQLILETLEGEMGRGRFQGNGKADLAGFELGPFSFILTLDEARVHLLPDLAATLDGELLFQRKGTTQTLQGELTLKKAIYEKRIDLKSLVVNSGKTREASFTPETPVIGRTILNVHLYGKEEIWINNNIAKIPLEVDLFLKGSFDDPLLIGRIDLPEGHVYFRRNDFKILSGSMEFLNPNKIDPTFDVKAKTEVRNFSSNITYAIDLSLTGTLSRFTLTLTSFPSLPEADILALLTLGKTTAEIAQAQRGGGGSEATSFVVSELLEGSIQKLTGVDRIQVDPYTSGTKSSSGTRLTAEKSLMEGRLLVIYQTTLDPSEEDLIRMVYEVNKNISLVGKRGDKGQIGGDLRFRFEFR